MLVDLVLRVAGPPEQDATDDGAEHGLHAERLRPGAESERDADRHRHPPASSDIAPSHLVEHRVDDPLTDRSGERQEHDQPDHRGRQFPQVERP